MLSETLDQVLFKDACWILENVGIKCNSREIIDIFEGTYLAGYDESIHRLFILKDLVKACIDAVPKKDTFPVKNHSFGGGGVAAFIKQGDDYVTPFLETHVAETMRLAEEFNIPFMFKPASRSFNWEEERKQVKLMRTYYSGYLYIRVQSQTGIDEVLEEHNNTGLICTTHSILNSPLKFNETSNNIDIFISCVRNNLPVYLTTMPISCLNGPATIYSNVLLAYTEFLVGLCAAQCINPGVVVVNGAYPTCGDPSNGYSPVLGSVFHNIMNWFMSKITKNIPTIQSGCTISGKYHDPQEYPTDYDTMTGYKIWNSLTNWHQVRHSFGFIDSLACFDIDKMRRDLICLSQIKESNEEVEVPMDDVWYDKDACYAIQEGVDKDGFMLLNHTLLNVGILDQNYDIRGKNNGEETIKTLQLVWQE